ncbi:unnamed protein product, partial [Sphacelaria rigidula]
GPLGPFLRPFFTIRVPPRTFHPLFRFPPVKRGEIDSFTSNGFRHTSFTPHPITRCHANRASAQYHHDHTPKQHNHARLQCSHGVQYCGCECPKLHKTSSGADVFGYPLSVIGNAGEHRDRKNVLHDSNMKRSELENAH